MTTAIENVDTYLEAFTQFAKRAEGHDLAWLKNLREQAFARFCETGFPTTHDEDWRFTNIAPVARTQFSFAKEASAVSDSDLKIWKFNGAVARLVFIDGYF